MNDLLILHPSNLNTLYSQEHWTNQETGLPIRKLITIALIIFFRNFATFFGNNFLPFITFRNQETVSWQSNFTFRTKKHEIQMPKRGFYKEFSQKDGAGHTLKSLNYLHVPRWFFYNFYLNLFETQKIMQKEHFCCKNKWIWFPKLDTLSSVGKKVSRIWNDQVSKEIITSDASTVFLTVIT